MGYGIVLVVGLVLGSISEYEGRQKVQDNYM